MLRMEWNALRIGDHVLVHDPSDIGFPLLAGSVVMVDASRSKSRVNGVGISVANADGGSRVVWPSYLAVHHDPPDQAEDCWRCAALAETAAQRLAETAA